MQRVVIDQPYTFIPPCFSRFWHAVVRRILPRHLRKEYGIAAVECHGAEKLRASLAAGHGVMIASNHCRPCDPMVLDFLAAEVRRPFHVIASWHVFMAGKIPRFLLPRMGAFSVYREGMDRESLKCAIQTVAGGRHPLVIFPEGIITRSNDRLVNFMEGTEFLARAAARERKQGKVVVHPVFIRYFFEGNLRETLLPVVAEIEARLAWRSQDSLPLDARIEKIGAALLGLKETEHLGGPQPGSIGERLQRLIDRLLVPLEDRWCAGRHDGDAMGRVKRLRAAILPALVAGELTDSERSGRWRDLADLYLVQQLHCYPAGYTGGAAPERLLETVERYEEDLTDRARAHFPLRAVITVGDAIEVPAAKESGDSLTGQIRRRMEAMSESSHSQRRVQPTGVDTP